MTEETSRGQAELAEWRKLLAEARQLLTGRAWAELTELAIITIDLPEATAPVFCHMMAGGNDQLVVRFLPGLEALVGFYRLAVSSGEDARRLGYEQEELRISFMPQSRLPKEWQALLAQIEGENGAAEAQPLVEARRPGYQSRLLREEEVRFLARAIKHLNAALRSYSLGQVKVDFAGGKTLLRYYDIEANMWLTREDDGFYPPLDYPALLLPDEDLANKLLRRPKIPTTLELDMFYLPEPTKDEEGLIFFPRLLLLGDREKGHLVYHDLLGPQDHGPTAVFKGLADYILSFGRPKTLAVCQEMYLQVLAEFCRNYHIGLEKQPQLPSHRPLRENRVD